MGFSANGCCTSSAESVVGRDFYGESELSDHELRFKSVLHRMVWDFGFGCVIPRRHRRRSFSRNNKAWLLAESGGCGADEPKSVHSSFRFSFCSQVELEAMAVLSGGCSSSATVLMVNLDGGVLTDSKSSERRGRRAELLERTINPVSHSLTRFTYPQILKATRNFSQDRVVGRGALSCVFRGRLGYMKGSLAIKRLNKEDKESSKAFCRELMVASSLHNPHIVPLVGFCIHSDGALFLVYKYVSGGSLEHFLHEKKRVGGSPSLPWPARYKIAIGIAEAIEYLHHGTDRCIVHRDMKPSNILLSSKRTPKLCDFGLATWTSAPSLPFLCKTVKGTFGYLAPEYFQHGKVSDRTDVYAFGVVLLELITGRKPIESRSGSHEENLVSWSKPLLQLGRFENLLDPQLRITPKNTDEIARMARAAAACLNNESQRPDIGSIAAILRGDEARKKDLLRVNSSIGESQRAKREMRSHFALAMLGVEFEDDDDLFSR